MSSEGWQTKRKRFQHDWLKNTFMLKMGAIENVLQGLVDDPTFSKESFFKAVREEWTKYRNIPLELATSYEREMSAAGILDLIPLTFCLEDSLWLRTSLHACWRVRHDVSGNSDAVMKAVIVVDDAVEAIVRGYQGISDEVLAAAVANLYDSCVGLAKAISRLLSTVRF